MALFSRKVDYALLILSYLHHRPEGSSARAVAERFGLKPAFAANVLKLLCRNGVVRSQRGIHGGYVLARPANTLFLDDLLTLLGEPFTLADCNQQAGEDACGLELRCPVRGAMAELNRRIRAELASVSLADLTAPTPDGVCPSSRMEVALIVQTGGAPA
ncbi:MAG: Rrf2 family transcriptional regulator [Gemmataceae bacterium]